MGMRRFAPDFDDEITTEVPTFRREAQELLHQLIGADIDPDEYINKLETVQAALLKSYQAGTKSVKTPHLATTQTTVRPRKSTYPGMGPASIHPPPLSPLDIDWSDLDD